MKKIVRLTESDLTRLVKRVIKEQEEPKQETLKKAAENDSEYLADWEDKTMYKRGFIEGAKWQQERMYSEEDMKLAFEAGYKKGFSGYPNTENWKELPFKEWFEQITCTKTIGN